MNTTKLTLLFYNSDAGDLIDKAIYLRTKGDIPQYKNIPKKGFSHVELLVDIDKKGKVHGFGTMSSIPVSEETKEAFTKDLYQLYDTCKDCEDEKSKEDGVPVCKLHLNKCKIEIQDNYVKRVLDENNKKHGINVFGSSPRDKGVRVKNINYYQSHWTPIEIHVPDDVAKSILTAIQELNMRVGDKPFIKYDFFGVLIGELFGKSSKPGLTENPNKYYCSEILGELIFKPFKPLNPNQLAGRMLKEYSTFVDLRKAFNLR